MISVIIAAYNRPEWLKELISTLREMPEEMEIVVADDGSKEPVVCGDRYLWREDTAYHKPWMVNQAVQMASGDVLAFLDDDTIPVSRLWATGHLKTLQAHPVSRGPFALCRRTPTGTVRMTAQTFGVPGTYWSCINTVMRREVWNQVEGYDQRYNGSYGFEDIDFGLKVRKAGVKVGFASRHTMVEHIGNPYCIRDGRLVKELSEKNRLLLEKKWGDSCDSLMKRSGWGAWVNK